MTPLRITWVFVALVIAGMIGWEEDGPLLVPQALAAPVLTLTASGEQFTSQQFPESNQTQ